MPSPMFPTLPSGLNFRVYPIPVRSQTWVLSTPMNSRHHSRRPLADSPLRWFRWPGLSLPPLDREWVIAWGRDELHNWVDMFYITMDHPLPRPYTNPTLAPVAGGALGQTTYYVTYTWGDGTLETTENTETSLLVAANNYLKVTLPRIFPTGVDRAHIYVGTSPGAGKLEATISTDLGSWTQSGALVGVTDPPATNLFMEVVPVFLAPGFEPEPTSTSPFVSDLVLEMTELPV